MPQVVPEIPPCQWQLSEQGYNSCFKLADQLKAWQPARIFSSQETKAQQTAQVIARELELHQETWPDLYEHRRDAGSYTNLSDFHASMAHLFAAPEQLVFGRETAHHAQKRFQTAIQRLFETHPGETLAVVTHGAVITLFILDSNAIEPFPFWNSLTLPSFVVLSLPDYKLISEPILIN